MAASFSTVSAAPSLKQQRIISSPLRSHQLLPFIRSLSTNGPQRCIGDNRKFKQFQNLKEIGAVGEKEAAPGTPTSVPVRVAFELLQAGHRYLDVRTPEEFSAGHVHGATNIPYLIRVGSGMAKNPRFLEQVLSHFGRDDEVIVGCQMGKRSLMAATDLHFAGFTGVIDMAGGYATWVENELPVE